MIWAVAIAGRLFVLQIVRHQEYVERAQKQQQRTFEVAPRRGVARFPDHLMDRQSDCRAVTRIV